MPEMGGAEAIRHIRAREKRHGRPHRDCVADRARAEGRPRAVPRHWRGRLRLEAGLPAALFAEIERVMTRAPEPATRATTVDVPDTLLARVGGSHEMLEEIIGLFLEDSPKLMDVHSGGAGGRRCRTPLSRPRTP